jgi:hypothetical protein
MENNRKQKKERIKAPAEMHFLRLNAQVKQRLQINIKKGQEHDENHVIQLTTVFWIVTS